MKSLFHLFLSFVLISLLSCKKNINDNEPAPFSTTEPCIVIGKYNVSDSTKSTGKTFEYYDNNGYLYKRIEGNETFLYLYNTDSLLAEITSSITGTIIKYHYQNGLKTLVDYGSYYYEYSYVNGINTSITRHDDIGTVDTTQGIYYINNGLVDSLIMKKPNIYESDGFSIDKLLLKYDVTKNIISKQILSFNYEYNFYYDGYTITDSSKTEDKYVYENNSLARTEHIKGYFREFENEENSGYDEYDYSNYFYNEKNNISRIEHYTGKKFDYFYTYTYYNFDGIKLHRVDLSKLNPPKFY